MVKASKFLVLVAGIAGLVGFFLPFMTVDVEGTSLGLSAAKIISGVDLAKEAVGEAAAESAEVSAADTAQIEDTLSKIKVFLYAVYAPALLLAIFGVVGAVRKRFGRGFGILGLLLGLLTLGVWALLNAAAGEVEGASMGLGFQLLLVTGLGGLVGGLIATVKPDRGA